MLRYELTFLFDSQDASYSKHIEDLLKKAGAKITTHDDWGVKVLSYPIKKRQEASYHHFEIEMDPKKIQDFDKKLLLDEKVLRYLLVKSHSKKAKKKTVKKKQLK